MITTFKNFFRCTILLFLVCLALPLTASTQKVYDNASLLSKEQVKELEDKITYLFNVYKIDVGIVTTKNLEGKTTRGYAQDFYNDTPYASDGLLLLIDMQNRVPHISTKGLATSYFKDERIKILLDSLHSSLKEGDFNHACLIFLDKVESYLKQGTPKNSYQHAVESKHIPFKTSTGHPLTLNSILLSIGACFIISSLLALLLRFAICYMYKHPKYSEPPTIPDDKSIHYTLKEDKFMHSSTSKVRIKRDSSNNGGGTGDSF